MTISELKPENIRIKSVTIKNYRGFFKEETIFLAQPDGKNNGSGLTIITGANNSGKTSILEAITVYPTMPGVSVKPDEHQEGNKASIIVKTTNEDYSYRYKVDEHNRQTYLWEETNNKTPKYIEPRLIATQRLSLDDDDQLRSEKGTTDGLLHLLRKKLGDKKTRKHFNKLLREIIPNFRSFIFPQEFRITKNLIKYNIDEGKSHSIDFLGSAVISIVRICAYLLFVEPSGILVIDEPELSLHPLGQKNLRKILSEYSRDRQIIIATHSPYFIDWNDFANGASYVSTKVSQGCCTIHHLKKTNQNSKKIKNINNNWKRPFTLDLVMKEIFFSNKILFVEGQEDVGLIKKWLRNEYKKNSQYTPSFEICGYGADGVNNIPIFLDMAKSLGINKVGVLTDELSKKDIKNFEDWKKSNKEHGYEFQQLITDDIRVKIKVDKLIEDCIDTSTGKLKNYPSIFEDIEKCISIKKEGYFDLKGEILKCDNCSNRIQVNTECIKECKNNALTEIFEKFDEYFF